MSCTVDRSHKYAIGDCVSALDGAPCVMLGFTKLCLLVGMPAYGCGIKKNVRSLQRSQASAFRVPLVPAHQSAHAAVLCIKGLKAEITGSEIELFVIQGIVRDVHLAIDSFQAAVVIENGCGVVIQAWGTPLEY